MCMIVRIVLSLLLPHLLSPLLLSSSPTHPASAICARAPVGWMRMFQGGHEQASTRVHTETLYCLGVGVVSEGGGTPLRWQQAHANTIVLREATWSGFGGSVAHK
ncbi:hypothetical protein HD554DRAFT_2035197 [Boletus coccyginus]|nr:hypothetical protein HD554DRAFT_2035197 [Boletus coccyginus]